MNGRHGFRTAGLTALHWFALGLAAISGAVHLGLGVVFLPEPLAIAFVLAGVGFFGAIVLFLLDVYRTLLYLLGIPFVGTQIVLWFLLNQPTGLANISAGEGIDKLAQFLLIVALVVLLYRDRTDSN